MAKRGHKLEPKVMGELTQLREELATILNERTGIKKAVAELYERDHILAALQYKVEWSIVNTEIAAGLKPKPMPRLLDPDGKHFWQGVEKVPHKHRPTKAKGPGRMPKMTPEEKKEVEENL